MKRTGLLIPIAFLIMFVVLGPKARSAGAAEAKLNVLFIAIDDLRPELGCYGQTHVRSPNIDRLASQGLLFERAYCQFAVCNQSRASLLAGRRPETLNVLDLRTFVRDGNPDVVTLPEHFKNHGYRALSIGKIFHVANGNHDDPQSWSAKSWKPGALPLAHGLDAEGKPAGPSIKGRGMHAHETPYAMPDVPDDALPDGKIAARAIEALRENRDRPFFLAVGFDKPHLPFVAPKRYWDLYDPASIALPENDTLPKDAPALASNDATELRGYLGVPKTGPAVSDAEARRLIHAYRACVSFADAQVGRVLDELDRLGLRDNTIVILFGDHGYHLGEQGTWNKNNNWELATRVPMILSAPPRLTPGGAGAGLGTGTGVGAKTRALVEFVDIYPTLVELCGLPMPEKLEGTSMVPLLADPGRPWKSAAFSVNQRKVEELGGMLRGRAMRTDRHRFIEWTVPGKEQKVFELYDHQTDPKETINLAGQPQHQALVERLSEQLHAGWRRAAEPALAAGAKQ